MWWFKRDDLFNWDFAFLKIFLVQGNLFDLIDLVICEYFSTTDLWFKENPGKAICLFCHHQIFWVHLVCMPALVPTYWELLDSSANIFDLQKWFLTPIFLKKYSPWEKRPPQVFLHTLFGGLNWLSEEFNSRMFGLFSWKTSSNIAN